VALLAGGDSRFLSLLALRDLLFWMLGSLAGEDSRLFPRGADLDLVDGRRGKSLARLGDGLRACLGSEPLAGLGGESLDGLGIKSLAGPKGEDSRFLIGSADGDLAEAVGGTL
jgi:hypothetical protein